MFLRILQIRLHLQDIQAIWTFSHLLRIRIILSKASRSREIAMHITHLEQVVIQSRQSTVFDAVNLVELEQLPSALHDLVGLKMYLFGIADCLV